MIVLVRWLLKLSKKEYEFISRYSRSHPHFFWYLALDAVVSALIGMVGFHFVTASTPSVTSVSAYYGGRMGLSADQFIRTTKRLGTSVYWLGPLSGSRYEINERTSGIHVVTYLQSSSDLPHLKEITLVIETYDNLAIHNSHITHFVMNKSIVTADNKTVEFNKDLMNIEMITIRGRPEKVHILYPAPQSEQTLLRNAARLELIPCTTSC